MFVKWKRSKLNGNLLQAVLFVYQCPSRCRYILAWKKFCLCMFMCFNSLKTEVDIGKHIYSDLVSKMLTEILNPPGVMIVSLCVKITSFTKVNKASRLVQNLCKYTNCSAVVYRCTS